MDDEVPAEMGAGRNGQVRPRVHGERPMVRTWTSREEVVRGQWWVDRRGGSPVRVQAVRDRGPAGFVVIVEAPGETARECERRVVDAGVFERWFVPLENASS